MTPETEEKLLGDVGFIRSETEAQSRLLDTYGKKLDSIDYTLNGNGVPGLKATVQAHEATLAGMKKVAWIIGTPVLTAVGGGIVTAIYWLCTRH